MHEHRFAADIERLRSPERLHLLEIDRVVNLCLEGLRAKSVLDVGVGSGVFAEAFSKRGLEVAGVDVNPEMIKSVRPYVPQADVCEASAEALPFQDDAFDLVFLGHVLHETDDPVTALKEARRVARQRIVILEWPYRDEEQGPPLDHRLKPEQVTAFVKQAGFESIETLQLKHMIFYRLAME